MTPEKLNEIFKASGLTQEQFARKLRKAGTSTVRAWLAADSYSDRVARNIELRVNDWQNRSKG